ncbi:MAG: YvcK family protein [Mollicutes bacterium]|nr:YvcK family protein [Mollicutes bacterium]
MANKKVVVLGGGTGMSFLLKGLKEYPLDITAVVSVCDDGGSTGILRDEFNMLAVGDIRKVLVSLSRREDDFDGLLNYRFKSEGGLKEHTVGNIILTAAANIKGSVQAGIEVLGKVLNLSGKVMPLTEDVVTLIGEMQDGKIIEGEHLITEANKKIKRVYYNKEPRIKKELIKTLENADIIVISMGSLYTSIIPTLLSKKVIDAIDNSKAKIVYSCNLFTQPGETDGYRVSDHINALNSYLGQRKIDYVIASNTVISKAVAKKYQTEEQKDPVKIDYRNIEKTNVILIEDKLASLSTKYGYKHDSVRLGFLIFSLAFNYNKGDKK